MKNRNILNILKKLSMIFMLVSISHAEGIPSNGSFLPSLDWQKMALEKSITDKVINSVSKIVKSNEYLVDVEINVNPPTKPRFTPSSNSPGGGGGEEEEKKSKVKISDAKPDTLPKDYIVFSKLGLEAPLIDDFEEEDPGTGEKGKDQKKPEDKLPPFEQLWKFNKSLDIFNNLESVKIYVQLSEKLHVQTRDNIKKILNNLKFNLNEITPELEITYINMDEKLNTLGIPTNMAELLELMAKFSNMIGLVLAAILLGIIAFMLFKKWENMEKEDGAGDAAAAAAPPPQEDKDEEEDKANELGGGGGGPFDGENTDKSTGVDRFQTFLSHSQIEAVMLVKRWISDEGKNEKNALRALVQQLENETLVELFQKLTPEERETWKSCLDKQVVGQDLLDANAFISNQIVEDILVPSAIVDADACDLLLKITPENAATFVKENPDLGKVLLNVMNVKFVSKVLEKLEEQYVDNILAKSMEYKKEEVDGLLNDFKASLAKYQETKIKIPFMQKLFDLVPMANPARENSLFKALAQNSEDSSSLTDVAMKFFPAVLVQYLPDNILKNILQSYPMAQKIELISSIDEDLREKFVNIFAPKGSKASDVLELELEKVETDLVVQKKIREHSDTIWKEFVEFSRKAIKADKANQGTFQTMVDQWASKVIAGQDPTEAAQGVDPEGGAEQDNVLAA